MYTNFSVAAHKNRVVGEKYKPANGITRNGIGNKGSSWKVDSNFFQNP